VVVYVMAYVHIGFSATLNVVEAAPQVNTSPCSDGQAVEPIRY
jgi:hypothetical protein